MSLVNKMLRDLDARHAAPGERAALPSAVTPLAARQAPSRGRGVWLGVALLLAGVVAAAGWWLSNATSPIATTPAPVVSAAPAAAPPNPLPPAVLPAPTLAAADLLPAPPPAAPDDPGLRLEANLATRPAEGPREEPAASKPRPAPVAIPAAPAAAPIRPPVTALPKEVSPASTTEPSISKQPRLPSAAERAEADYRRGLAAQRQGQTEEAAARYQAALSEQAEHTAARQSLAALLIELRRYDEADAVLRQGLALGPARLASTLALARLNVERGQTAEALELLLGNAAAGERSADYQGFAAALLNRAGRHQEAAERYQAAARLAPGEGRWWAGLGIVLDAQGKTAEAREAYQRARGLPGLPADLALHIDQRLR